MGPVTCRGLLGLLLCLPPLAVFGCGYSQEEWDTQRDAYERMQEEYKAIREERRRVEADIAEAEAASAHSSASKPSAVTRVRLEPAPSGHPGEPRHALVVGNGGYRSNPLANPKRDARLMASALQEVGFEVMLVIDAGQRDFKRTIEDFGTKLTQGGVGLFYFAGHGVQVNGKNYMIPVDVTIRSEREVDIESVNVARVLERMHSARTRVNIVILDACRDNPFERSFRSAERGLAIMPAPEGTLIAYATEPNRTAADGSVGNSPYTAALADAMREPGLKVEDVFKRVRVRVHSVTGKAQTPWEHSSLMGDFYFVRD